MSELKHTVLAGGGRVGRRVACTLAARGEDVTIIEPDPEGLEELRSDNAVSVVVGDATRPSILSEALTDNTGSVGALTDRADTNLAVCMAAKHIQSDIRTVARIEDEHGDEYTEYVDTVYFPERASVKAAVNAVTGSDIHTLEGATGDMELLDIRVDYDAPVAGKKLRELDLPDGTLVVAKTDGSVTAQPQMKLVPGRRYIVAADIDVSDDAIRAFQGEV